MTPEDLRRLLDERGAIYEVRKDEAGKRLSQLVGYAGKYDGEGGKKAYVGEKYYDFARVEQDPSSVYSFAGGVHEAVFDLHPDVILGMPMGGIAFSLMLADQVACSFAFAEKKVTAVATGEAREQSKLVIARHKITPGARVVLGEDVSNNFTTTADAIELVDSLGAQVVAIACAINRSITGGGQVVKVSQGLPVIAALEIPTEEYKQDDEYVCEDIKANNVVWKPKEHWDDLIAAMKG